MQPHIYVSALLKGTASMWVVWLLFPPRVLHQRDSAEWILLGLFSNLAFAVHYQFLPLVTEATATLPSCSRNDFKGTATDRLSRWLRAPFFLVNNHVHSTGCHVTVYRHIPVFDTLFSVCVINSCLREMIIYSTYKIRPHTQGCPLWFHSIKKKSKRKY